jgi:hypothetical protein
MDVALDYADHPEYSGADIQKAEIVERCNEESHFSISTER